MSECAADTRHVWSDVLTQRDSEKVNCNDVRGSPEPARRSIPQGPRAGPTWTARPTCVGFQVCVLIQCGLFLVRF